MASNAEGSGQEAPEGGSVDQAEKRIQELEAQVKEKESKYLYLYAEFENYKKRSIKERSDTMKFGWESVAR
ncbi:MAG: nucleotide exchange factor GrpE, partial [Bdellovibrionota bacterium]